MKVELIISDGGKEVLKTTAAGEKSDAGWRVDYLFEGGEYSLFIGANAMEHRGADGVSLVFERGAATKAVIADGAFYAETQIFTSKLKITNGARGCRAEAEYFFVGDGENVFSRTVTLYAK